MPYKKPMPAPKKPAKGGGKAASGSNLYTPVKQSTINSIKKMGMSAALKKAGSSNNAEFVQGVKRMYGANRLKAAMKSAKAPAPRTSRTTSATAPKLATPKTSRTKPMTIGTWTLNQQIFNHAKKDRTNSFNFFYRRTEKLGVSFCFVVFCCVLFCCVLLCSLTRQCLS